MKRVLSKRTGAEGPKHDPYSYVEYIVETEEFTIVLHTGLVEWLKADGRIVKTEDKSITSPRLFEILTGIEAHKFDKYYNRIHGPMDRCSECNKYLQSAKGYVGELMLFCPEHGIQWCEEVTEEMIR